MNLRDMFAKWIRNEPEDPAHRAERKKIEAERDTIKMSQMGPGRGPSPSPIPPTPDTLDPDN